MDKGPSPDGYPQFWDARAALAVAYYATGNSASAEFEWTDLCRATPPPPPATPTNPVYAKVCVCTALWVSGLTRCLPCTGPTRGWFSRERAHGGPCVVECSCQGGWPVRIPDPPPPLHTPPKFSNPSFSNLRFWGKGSAPKALKIFLCPSRGRIFFFFCPMCLYSKYSEFCGEFKNV